MEKGKSERGWAFHADVVDLLIPILRVMFNVYRSKLFQNRLVQEKKTVTRRSKFEYITQEDSSCWLTTSKSQNQVHLDFYT